VRCVLVRAGDRVFAIPSEEIVTTTLWSNLSATLVEPGVSIGEEMPCYYSWHQQEGEIPALDLLQYWQPGSSARSLPDTAICMRIRSASATSSTLKQDAWLLADDLLEQSDLLISPLPHPLIAPLGLMGMSLQTNGKLIPVLEPATLAAALWAGSATNSQLDRAEPSVGGEIASILQPKQERATSIANILVVDDAALVRRRIEASLTAYGYIIHTCRDGMEAWNWLQSNHPPAMLITDIEMPGMDGFTLIDRCRQDGMNLPILVVSSRLSEEWGKEARRLGATDYLTKGFTTSELLSKVNQYIAQ
jgi:chemosensory pili system protein ChpA (sensor histidine kinase/response regulator)